MKLDFFMLADGASSPDGKVYIHGGAITRVYPTDFPAGTLVTAVARFLVDPGDIGGSPHTVSIEWANPVEPESWRPVAGTEVVVHEPEKGLREGEDVGVVIMARQCSWRSSSLGRIKLV